MIALIIEITWQAMVAFLLGTLVFDILHYFFHLFVDSKYQLLKKIGNMHMMHHRFYTSNLKIHKEWQKQNFINHILVEYCSQLLGITICFLFFNPLSVVIALAFETIIFINVCLCKGVDARHKPYDVLPAEKGGIFVDADYHALHHVHPNKFFSSYIKLLDYILGTAHYLKGKNIVMTGASGALGSHMKKLLEKEDAHVTCLKYGVDYTYDDYERLKKPLESADILLLCHGSKFENAQQANCDSFVRIIELYKSVRKRALVPVEVWGTGSEIECHPCFGIKKIQVYAASKRNYARNARQYYRDRDMQYRHLVHSAFISQMGPGLMTANFAAKVTLFLIKRGFKYVPVTYTGFAFLNYLRFIFNK